jgi:hypothetical protein
MRLEEEDAKLLIRESSSDKSILVGGQAVAFWAGYYGIKSELPSLTSDIDYLGSAADARKADARITFKHSLKIATLDDATPNTAVITVEIEGYESPVLIDYLASIIGVDAREIHKGAVLVEFDGVPLHVLHPLALLESKIHNLYRIEAKRGAEGREQARLAIEIARAFLIDQINAGLAQKDLLRLVQQVAKFAATIEACFSRIRFSLECLHALPERIHETGVLPAPFQERQWPQLVKAIERTTAKLRLRFGLPGE